MKRDGTCTREVPCAHALRGGRGFRRGNTSLNTSRPKFALATTLVTKLGDLGRAESVAARKLLLDPNGYTSLIELVSLVTKLGDLGRAESVAAR